MTIVIEAGTVVMFPKGSIPEADDLFDQLFPEDGASNGSEEPKEVP